MPFKIGSFNLIPSFIVMTACIAGVGVVPYYVKLLISGEAGTVKDDFEAYMAWKPAVWDARAPYAQTAEFQRFQSRDALEASWRTAHAQAASKPLA